jgi:hypothetical protein
MMARATFFVMPPIKRCPFGNPIMGASPDPIKDLVDELGRIDFRLGIRTHWSDRGEFWDDRGELENPYLPVSYWRNIDD